MNDRTLFDVDRTTTAKCDVCGATREPDEPRAQNCRHDTSLTQEYLRRPKGCLNAHDPAHAPFPEGF